MAKDNRRHRVIIDRERQVKLMLTTLIYILVTILVVATAVFFPSMIDLSGEFSGAADYQMEAKISAGSEFATLHHRFWPAVLLVVILLGLHSLVVLHRVFGPLYRLRMFLEQVGGGDLSSKLAFRKDDFLIREQHTVNKMLEALNDKFGRVKTSHASLDQSIGALLDAAGAGEVEASVLSAKIKEIGERQAELSQALKAIKTSAPKPGE